ncbi:MAG: capsular biosynthesis protein, partial [Monoglobales bacterium]
DFLIAPTSSAYRKVLGYFKFFKLAWKTISREKYSKIILLTSVPAVCLSNILRRKYDGKFIVDIRDYYMENNWLYYALEKKAIEHSALSVISSKGFEQFLPQHDYVIAHNINWLPAEVIQSFRSQKEKKDCIYLSYIGSMRFPQRDREVIDFFANDSRFHINLFGSGYEIHSAYCAENNINNVTIIDWFPSDKTIDLYRETDIVLNLYGSGTPTLDYALSNKLYYAAQLGKPILVCHETYMERVSVKYNFGFALNPEDEDVKSKLYEYYNTINWKQFYENCDEFLKVVHQEDSQFERYVREFLR